MEREDQTHRKRVEEAGDFLLKIRVEGRIRIIFSDLPSKSPFQRQIFSMHYS